MEDWECIEEEEEQESRNNDIYGLAVLSFLFYNNVLSLARFLSRLVCPA